MITPKTRIITIKVWISGSFRKLKNPAAAGIGRPTTSVAIVNEGDAKKLIAEIQKAE